MNNIKDNLKEIFYSNKKCIVNADLDGILSGMLLQHFLNWEVVGYSSCCGKSADELWLQNETERLQDCVFVDLPVCIPSFSAIDQHFVAFDNDSVDNYLADRNKVNPNIMRNRVFNNNFNHNEYAQKYPFGTVHFILALLENFNIINENNSFDFEKPLENFDLADLFFRADRVIGNTCTYMPNCLDWAKWLRNIGRENTYTLFTIAQNQYQQRQQAELRVEHKLKSLGCIGKDGDCSNLFRAKSYQKLNAYFNFLSNALHIAPLPLYKIYDFGKLYGARYNIDGDNYYTIKAECEQHHVFSYAFVSKSTLSITYFK